ncbi:hypothetical protein SADUNF_Sadunf01G0109800 [Salix dunnii]|uniref:PCI domain-containing protein n=1 Tax=Salix dunnii TaxID=1413687 RepID=A0A835NAY2_9ROSI|nr:hypothetical protein SADUNF_Sadunf01G0109800 [Salix dunnii]
MAALQYLETLRNAHPELDEWYNSISDLYQKKLWHQLTLKLEQFVALAVFQTQQPVKYPEVYALGHTHFFSSLILILAGDALIQFYQNFITDFETKINLLKLAHFAVIVSRRYTEKDAAIGYLEGVIEKLQATREQRIEEPVLYIKMQIAIFKLEQGDQKECKRHLEDGKSTLDSMTDIDPSVYASYYWVSSQYYKHRQEFAEFYKSALLYLAYTSVESLSDSFKLFHLACQLIDMHGTNTRFVYPWFPLAIISFYYPTAMESLKLKLGCAFVGLGAYLSSLGFSCFAISCIGRIVNDSWVKDLAFDLSLSALLGDNIYNFGELLAHPIIKSLLGTQVEWLYYILQSFNSGDLVCYQELCRVHNAALRAQPALVQNEPKLLEKINILCLMEIIFSRPSEDRTIPLNVIAERTKLSIEDVEHLLMKSLSVHLIEGIIDQVEGTVHVSWVQPRVLGIPQIKSLRDRLDNWLDKVHTALLSVEAETPDLVAS